MHNYVCACVWKYSDMGPPFSGQAWLMLRHAWRSAPIPAAHPHASQREHERVRGWGLAPDNVHAINEKEEQPRDEKGKAGRGVTVPETLAARVFNELSVNCTDCCVNPGHPGRRTQQLFRASAELYFSLITRDNNDQGLVKTSTGQKKPPSWSKTKGALIRRKN